MTKFFNIEFNLTKTEYNLTRGAATGIPASPFPGGIPEDLLAGPASPGERRKAWQRARGRSSAKIAKLNLI